MIVKKNNKTPETPEQDLQDNTVKTVHNLIYIYTFSPPPKKKKMNKRKNI